jgi:hypothetical protein
MEKKIGDTVWLDGYTSFAQQNSQEECEIEKIDYKFDKDTGEKFAIYFVADRWFDSRDGGEYDNPESMYYIEI